MKLKLFVGMFRCGTQMLRKFTFFFWPNMFLWNVHHSWRCHSKMAHNIKWWCFSYKQHIYIYIQIEAKQHQDSAKWWGTQDIFVLNRDCFMLFVNMFLFELLVDWTISQIWSRGPSTSSCSQTNAPKIDGHVQMYSTPKSLERKTYIYFGTAINYTVLYRY